MSIRERLTQPGFVVSALVHAGALAATLIAFSTTEKFDDLQENVPVEVVTDNQFNQIMKGDKSAKEVRPDATPGPQQSASLEQPATEPQPQATTPPPPPPPPPPVAAEPPPPVPTPPERPNLPDTPPPPPVPTPPVRDVEAEPMLPKPVPKPVPKPTPPVPLPPVVPHPAPPKPQHEVHLPPPPKPRPVEKPKPDLLAKLMEEQPADTPQPSPKPSPRRKPAPDASEDSKFDPTDISKLLSHDAPAQHASSGQMAHLASLGSPTASAPKMSPSFWAGLDSLMEDQYRGCWSYLGLATGEKYVPQVRVVYAADGTLEGQPVLINPPSDPSMQSLADSALRAVRKCNPLKIPEQYAPYYDQWKGRVLRFDPAEMAG